MRASVLVFLCVSLTAAGQQTALDRYVNQPDPTYKWRVAQKYPGKGMTTIVLEMTSQTWLTPAEVDQTEWKHWLVVHKPDTLGTDAALLLIEGGSSTSKPPSGPDAFLASVAMKTKSVAVQLRMIPNQPLSFYGESRRRTEDAIIAYTWQRYLETGDERWPARLPMTKAAVRAMDAVAEFIATEEGGRGKVARWVVTGGSKRGWTTWTTAAVDARVAAIAPIVIDVLNVEESFRHHWRAYGFWAPAVKDYVAQGIMNWMGTPQFRKLLDLVDPYSYRERLAMPKFIMNSAGDEFFLPDSSRFYFDDLPGEKYLRYVPNSDHSLRRTDAEASLAAWYDGLLRNVARPRFSWKFERGARSG